MRMTVCIASVRATASRSPTIAQRRRGAEVKMMDENTIGTKLIEDKVIAELKSVEKVSPANNKQTQTYLPATNRK